MKRNPFIWLFTFVLLYLLGLSIVWNSIIVPWDNLFLLDFFPLARCIIITVLILFGASHVADVLDGGFDSV